MRVLVFGAGAMGSFFGGLLSRRNDVTLVCRRDHADAIRRAGLRITGKTSLIAHPEVATSAAAVKRPDIILVSTKAYDTASAARALRKFARAATWMTLQNGLDNPDVLARVAAHVVAGVTSHGVTFLRPGEIRHAGVGDTAIGAYAGVDEATVVLLRDLLEEAGVRTRISQDIRRELWLKVIVNAGINPLAALTRLRNGHLAKSPALAAAMAGICAEAAGVARAEGYDITGPEAADAATKVARRTRENRASMLQDVERGRPTEIESITGAVLRAAARHGVEAPRNAMAYALVQGLERSSRAD